nr:hypothetical protein [Corynebacterium diphtheriae]
MLLRHVLKLIQYLLVTPTVASDNHSIRWCIPAHLKEKNMECKLLTPLTQVHSSPSQGEKYGPSVHCFPVEEL